MAYNNISETLSNNDMGRQLWNSKQKEHCVAIETDAIKLRKVSGQKTAVTCTVCHSIACPEAPLLIVSGGYQLAKETHFLIINL